MATKDTQVARILRRLKQEGELTNVQLNRMGVYRYSARIMDLRREGHDILSVREKGGLWRYVYRGDDHVQVAA